MTTFSRRRMAGLGMAALVATVGIGWRAATVPAPEPAPVRAAAPTSPWWLPWLTTTTAPKATTTTVHPTTTTVAAPTTTIAPPTTTPAPRVTTTTRPRVSTTTPPPAPAPPATSAPVTGGPPASIQAQLLNAVNARRATGTTCGGAWYPAVPTLTLQSQLTSAAQGHANDMATRNYFGHNGLDGSTPISRINATGYRGNAWAENIAAGQTSVDEVMSAWWSSTGHCQDFMANFVTQVGFGLAQNPSSTYRIYWVADMARPG